MSQESLETPTVESNLAVEALVDCPGVQGLYTYAVPSHLSIQIGDILSVPFSGRQLSAIAVRWVPPTTPDRMTLQLKAVTDVVSHGFFSKDYWKLLEQVANYYQTPLIQVIRTALPPGLLAKSQRKLRLINRSAGPESRLEKKCLSPTARQLLALLERSPTGEYTWQYLQRQQRGARNALRQLLQAGWVESYIAPPQPPKPKLRQAVTTTAGPSVADPDLSARQQEILLTLQRQGGELWLSDALQRLHTTSQTLRRLADRGYLTIQPREVLRVGSHSQASPDQPKALTPDQAQVLKSLAGLSGYARILLHGVTGSGKTEVYLQAIAPYLTAQKSVLVLVPEIGLTPQLTDRFRSRFGEQVCVYHSGLSEGERYDTWRHLLSPQPKVVIGTRSAIFTPLPNLGLIVLDEEHDSSYKQDQPMPCYHARTVAKWRAQQVDCPLLLGSATPSLESWIAAQSNVEDAAQESPGKLGQPDDSIRPPAVHYLSMPTRISARPLPPVKVVDMRQELYEGNRSMFSRALQAALKQMKADGHQGLLFIQRRGHSRFVSCRSCGYVVECPNCDVSLAYHRPSTAAYLRCHYCGFTQGQPAQCPDCGSPYLKNFGSGTQRVVDDLAQNFPEVRCIRFDSDTTRAKGAHRALLQRFADGEADLLVGTQMLTKGIDLPRVTVVGVMAADGLLHLADYWSAERAFQTLTQVAGRAGRGELPGQAIVQTYTPEHFAIQAVQQHSYADFIEQEQAQRRALGYPPYGRLILLRLSSLDATAVEQAAYTCVQALQTAELTSGVDILGPVPAPILRVANRYRWQVLLKSPADRPLPTVSDLRHCVGKQVSLSIDVDPLNLS
ncbi:MAG: primosomal protein N' [Cyanobacteria bacterium J06648_16]